MTEPLESLPTAELESVHGGYSDQLFAAMQHAVSMGMTINSTTTGGHATHSYHYQGRAFDTIGTPQQMNQFYDWASRNVRTTELIHGRHFLKNGRPVAPIGGHDNHVHVAI